MLIPFNIDLLLPTAEDVKHVQPVTAMDSMEGKTKGFHSRGLFSTEIFGKVGDERRNRQFSYIDLHTSVFHPIVYNALVKLKALYGDILSGAAYATWDATTNDFVKTTPLEGETGYHFFVSHFPKLALEHRRSDRREALIALVTKYRERCWLERLLVLPAGLRDFEYDDAGKPTQDEVNTYYRTILSLSGLVVDQAILTSPSALDATRLRMQKVICEIYAYFEQLLAGKKKLVLGKWGSRRIYNGTRNVITSMRSDTSVLHSPLTIKFNQTAIGLYQYMVGALPKTQYALRNGFLETVFPEASVPAQLVDKKTWKRTAVPLKPSYYDAWMTDEGLQQVISNFASKDLRFLPVEAEGYYFGLVYTGPDGTYRVFQDIDELPKDRDRAHVRPLTLFELFYLAVYKTAANCPVFVTRYPVINHGGTYPSLVFLKTTINSEVRSELGPDWQPTGAIVYQYPVLSSSSFDSMSPHPCFLARMGADFDGDTVSGNFVYTEEAVTEVHAFLSSRACYVGPSGRMYYSAANDTVNYVLANITNP